MKLYINEYKTASPSPKPPRSRHLYAYKLKAAGVQPHGLGVHAHETVAEVPPLADIKQYLAEFAALGVEVAITELDMRPDDAGLVQQRRDFETIVRACREVERCFGRVRV